MFVTPVETDVEIGPGELPQVVDVSGIAVKARRLAMNMEHEIAAPESIERLAENVHALARNDAPDETDVAYFAPSARLAAKLGHCEAMRNQEQAIPVDSPLDKSVAMKTTRGDECLARIDHSAHVRLPRRELVCGERPAENALEQRARAVERKQMWPEPIQARDAARAIQGFADAEIFRAYALTAETNHPVVVKSHHHWKPTTTTYVDHRGREARQMMNVDEVGSYLVEKIIESRVDRRMCVEELEAIQICEVVCDSSYPNAFPFAARELEFSVLIAREPGEYLDFVPAIP